MMMLNVVQIKAESLILEGEPKDKICQATEQMQVDLLVLGSRGLGKIKR
jgi:nucleotide-binding universal stress UspA family protein